jgi:hypothetical protein
MLQEKRNGQERVFETKIFQASFEKRSCPKVNLRHIWDIKRSAKDPIILVIPKMDLVSKM